jgi:hypothetical protein
VKFTTIAESEQMFHLQRMVSIEEMIAVKENTATSFALTITKKGTNVSEVITVIARNPQDKFKWMDCIQLLIRPKNLKSK